MILRCCILALSVLSLAGSLFAAEEEPPKPFPRMSQFIGEMVNRFYYDQQRVNPSLMLEHSMRKLEESEISFRAEISADALRLEGLGESQSIPLPRLGLSAIWLSFSTAYAKYFPNSVSISIVPASWPMSC